MSVFNVITLFGGLAMFLYGMRLMSSGLKEGSTGTLKKIMEKVTNNIFMSFLLGLLVTALIQSSTATIVITSGLVAANIISLKQSIGVIVGANVGTTVTGQIIRLMDLNSTSTEWLQFFKPSTLAPIALIIGIILIMFLKFKKSDVVGQICMGFGILFTGLMNMTAAVDSLSATGIFDRLFVSLGDNPIIGYLVGALVSFILQSSSATVGILQAFSVSGQLFFKSIYSVLLGIYLGDCLTTSIVCSIGAKSDARRVGIINVLFNLSETVIVFVAVTLAHSFGLLDSIWNIQVNSGVIANTNTVFNLGCAIILLPIVSKYEKLSKIIVKDEETGLNKYADKLNALDTKFFVTPALAFNSAYRLLITQFDIVKSSIDKAFGLYKKYDQKIFDEINENENIVDEMTDRLENYLVQLNPHISSDEHIAIMSQYHNDLIEFERLGDYAVNISEYAKKMNDENIKFSKDAEEELNAMIQIIDKILDYSRQAFEKRDIDAANHIEPLEQVVDDLTAALKNNHLDRLQKGGCNVISGTLFLDILSDVERISDTCSNIGIATVTRVMPQYTDKMHDYMSQLHEGSSEQFNTEYNEAHSYYFGLLPDNDK